MVHFSIGGMLQPMTGLNAGCIFLWPKVLSYQTMIVVQRAKGVNFQTTREKTTPLINCKEQISVNGLAFRHLTFSPRMQCVLFVDENTMNCHKLLTVKTDNYYTTIIQLHTDKK